MLFLTEDNSRVIVRPSGTEPKLKCYLEVIAPVADGDDLASVRTNNQQKLIKIANDVRAALGL